MARRVCQWCYSHGVTDPWLLTQNTSGWQCPFCPRCDRIRCNQCGGYIRNGEARQCRCGADIRLNNRQP